MLSLENWAKRFLIRRGYHLSRPDFSYRENLLAHIDYAESEVEVSDERAPIRHGEKAFADQTITAKGLSQVLDIEEFRGKRILEIGPKNGYHSLWIDENLNPSELVLCDLPSKEKHHLRWKEKLRCRHHWVLEDLLHARGLDDEAKFDLVFFLGVIYHNVEQVKLLSLLNGLTATGGHMLFQSAVDLRPDPVIRLGYRREVGGNAYPSVEALKIMLCWTGWKKITRYINYRPKHAVELFLCQKTSEPEENYKGSTYGGSRV